MNVRFECIYALFAIFLIVPYLPVNVAQFIGPAYVTLLRAEKCGEDGEGVHIEFEVHKFNRTHQGIDVLIETEHEIGDDIQLNATAAKWGDGGWKPHIYDLFEPNACNFAMKYAEDKFKELLIQNNQAPECPAKKGKYEVKNYYYDGSLSVPIMYGDFMIDMLLTKNGVQMVCIRSFIRSEPKKKSPYMGFKK